MYVCAMSTVTETLPTVPLSGTDITLAAPFELLSGISTGVSEEYVGRSTTSPGVMTIAQRVSWPTS